MDHITFAKSESPTAGIRTAAGPGNPDSSDFPTAPSWVITYAVIAEGHRGSTVSVRFKLRETRPTSISNGLKDGNG